MDQAAADRKRHLGGLLQTHQDLLDGVALLRHLGVEVVIFAGVRNCSGYPVSNTG